MADCRKTQPRQQQQSVIDIRRATEWNVLKLLPRGPHTAKHIDCCWKKTLVHTKSSSLFTYRPSAQRGLNAEDRRKTVAEKKESFNGKVGGELIINVSRPGKGHKQEPEELREKKNGPIYGPVTRHLRLSRLPGNNNEGRRTCTKMPSD